MPEGAFQEQEIVVTVPASFDAVAATSPEGCRAGGLSQFRLLEEPQAAFTRDRAASGLAEPRASGRPDSGGGHRRRDHAISR